MRGHYWYYVVRHGSAWVDYIVILHDHPFLCLHSILITDSEKVAWWSHWSNEQIDSLWLPQNNSTLIRNVTTLFLYSCFNLLLFGDWHKVRRSQKATWIPTIVEANSLSCFRICNTAINSLIVSQVFSFLSLAQCLKFRRFHKVTWIPTVVEADSWDVKISSLYWI